MSIEKLITDVISDCLDVDKDLVTPDASLMEDLGGDALNISDVFLVLEESYGLKIQSWSTEKIKTVGDLIKYVEENQ